MQQAVCRIHQRQILHNIFRTSRKDHRLPLVPFREASWNGSSVLLAITDTQLAHCRHVPTPSMRERIKGFIRNPASTFSSNSRAARNSRAHHSPPNIYVDVAASRPTSVSPANVSSRTDLVSGNDTASTPKSAPTCPGKRIVYTWFTSNASILLTDHVSTSNVATSALTGSRSHTVQETGNVTSHAPPQIADPVGPALPLSTTHPPHDHGQNSRTERSFLMAWHGVEQLLKRVEGCLGGTPFKVPVSVLNTVIDIGKVCSHLAESRCKH
jgi:hypothetical protein